VNVVLDTNVLIAAVLSNGKCADVVRHCMAKNILTTSLPLMDELREKLEKKFKLPGVAERTVNALQRDCRVVEPAPLPIPVCRDPDDDVVLATAVAGSCDLIVTGDRDLLVLKSYQGIEIVTPGEFWAREHGQA